MRQPWTPRSPRRIGMAVGLVALVAVLLITVIGGSSSRRPKPGRLVVEHCRSGTVPAEGPGSDERHADGRRPCVPLGQPETFADLSSANTELQSRQTAPFGSVAPGAYLAAVAQRQGMPQAGAASGGGGHWKLAGRPPLCAAPTPGGKACPPPDPANGNYSYMGSLGFRTLSGRISSFAYDPAHQGHYFASPVIGGVWESHNGGATWRSIGNNLPSQVVGSIAYDRPLHRILVGTGDNSFGGDGIAGPGVYYSSNDGGAWHRAAGIPQSILTFKVVVSPVGDRKSVV